MRAARPAVVGLALVGLSTMMLGSTPVFARLAYDAGSDAAMLTFGRYVIAGLVGLAVLLSQGRAVPLQRSDVLPVSVLGLVSLAQSLAYLGAVTLIPVGVAHVLLFLFPLIAAILVWAVDRQPVPSARFLALAIALVGVALTSGAAPQAVDPTGVGLGILAALGTAIFIVFGSRISRRSGALTFVSASYLAAALASCVGMAVVGDLAFPATALGWGGLIGASLLFILGILAFFAALSRLDTVRASLIANLEPLVAIGLAFVVLSERLSAVQLIGAALVVGAILAAEQMSRVVRPSPGED